MIGTVMIVFPTMMDFALVKHKGAIVTCRGEPVGRVRSVNQVDGEVFLEAEIYEEPQTMTIRWLEARDAERVSTLDLPCTAAEMRRAALSMR